MYRYFYHTNDKDAVLAHSHYSDPAFSQQGGATIFGKKVEGAALDYADRLRQWDREKYEAAWETAVEACGKKNTARRIEKYLQEYYGNQTLELVAIISGTRRDNGYPWFAYGYLTHEEA